MSAINRIPMQISGYLCVVCGKWHKRKKGTSGSKSFWEHYRQNEGTHGKVGIPPISTQVGAPEVTG